MSQIERFASKFKQITEEEWQSSTLKRTLQISLLKGPGYLQELAEELQHEGHSLLLSEDLVERALYARLTVQSNTPPFIYLIGVISLNGRCGSAARIFSTILENSKP